MKLFLASAVMAVVFACGGSPKKSDHSPGPGSDTASDSCCCKSNPLTSEDGKPVYEIGNRMECSQKQGECVADVQCTPANPSDATPPAPGQ